MARQPPKLKPSSKQTAIVKFETPIRPLTPSVATPANSVYFKYIEVLKANPGRWAYIGNVPHSNASALRYLRAIGLLVTTRTDPLIETPRTVRLYVQWPIEESEIYSDNEINIDPTKNDSLPELPRPPRILRKLERVQNPPRDGGTRL